MEKVAVSTDKRLWSPSFIPGVVTLVSTANPKGEPNVAPKSWVQMVSFEPSIVMFSGTKGNTTENNIVETKCFCINLVNSRLVDKVFNCTHLHGKERIDFLGLTF